MNIEMANMCKKFNIFLFSFIRADLLLTSLVHESALIPARLIMEHCMLVAALHANVGTEVGRVTTCHVSRVTCHDTIRQVSLHDRLAPTFCSKLS